MWIGYTFHVSLSCFQNAESEHQQAEGESLTDFKLRTLGTPDAVRNSFQSYQANQQREHGQGKHLTGRDLMWSKINFSIFQMCSITFARTSTERRSKQCVDGRIRRSLRCPNSRTRSTCPTDTSSTAAAMTLHAAARATKPASQRRPKK